MEIGVIVELISTLGFPVALVIAMGFFIFRLWKQSVEREKALMAEITENRIVNAKAIETITLYAERLGHIETDLTDIKNDVTAIKDNINQ
jgi:chromosome segregation ATPase